MKSQSVNVYVPKLGPNGISWRPVFVVLTIVACQGV